MVCFGFAFATGLQVEMVAPVANPGACIEQKLLLLKVSLQNLQELLLDIAILHLIFRFVMPNEALSFMHFSLFVFCQMCGSFPSSHSIRLSSVHSLLAETGIFYLKIII